MQKRIILSGIILFLLAVGVGGLWHAGAARGFPYADLDPDEPLWTAYSYLGFHVGFVQRQWFHEIWLLGDPHIGMTPWVGKFLIGGYLHWLGLSGAWNPRIVHRDHRQSVGWNAYNQYLPDLSAVLAARRFIIPFGVGTALIFGLMLTETSGWLGGLFMVLLCAHPLFRQVSTHVFLDVPALFFSALSLLLFWGMNRRSGSGVPGSADGRSVMGSELLLFGAGVCAGLAVGTKMRELVLLLFYGGLLVRYLLQDPETPNALISSAARRLGIMLIIGVCVFLVVNPGSYTDPVRSCFLFWNLGDFQQQEVRELKPQESLFSRRDKASFFWNTLFVEGRSPWVTVWEFPLMAGGLAAVFLTFWRGRYNPGGAELLLLLYFLLIFAANLWWMPQAYPRYVLPCLFLLVFLQARGLAEIVKFLTGWLRPGPREGSR